MNFWNGADSTVGNLDGKYFPILFRIAGTLTDSSVKALALFFDEGVGFYQDPYSNKVACASSEQSNIDNETC